jgi:hypothetical protein
MISFCEQGHDTSARMEPCPNRSCTYGSRLAWFVKLPVPARWSGYPSTLAVLRARCSGKIPPECAVRKVLNARTHNSAREGASGRYRNHDRHWWQLAGCEDAWERSGTQPKRWSHRCSKERRLREPAKRSSMLTRSAVWRQECAGTGSIARC